MKARGAVIVDPADIPTLGTFDDATFDVLLYEFKADLNKYLAWLGPASPVHSLKDVIAFNDAHRERGAPLLRPGALHHGRGQGAADERGVHDALGWMRGGTPARTASTA